jgi:hypothetical protein
VANHKKTQKKRKPSKPLPKVGTPANDAYRLHESREDLLDFGLTRVKRGPLNWLILAIVLVVVFLGAVALIALT